MSGVLTGYPATSYLNQVTTNALTTQLTLITHTAPDTSDYAIQGITGSSPYGFVSANEGNTVLAVIANLQTRLSELETYLDAFNILA